MGARRATSALTEKQADIIQRIGVVLATRGHVSFSDWAQEMWKLLEGRVGSAAIPYLKPLYLALPLARETSRLRDEFTAEAEVTATDLPALLGLTQEQTPPALGLDEQRAADVEAGEVFTDWKPADESVITDPQGNRAKPPPGNVRVVESTNLSLIDAPIPTVPVNLPENVVPDGVLHAVQYEAVRHAIDAHETMVAMPADSDAPPGAGAEMRQAAFFGHGTGFGKTRAMLAVILHNMREAEAGHQSGHGRAKAVWVTPNAKLVIEDIKAEWEALGQNPDEVQIVPPKGQKITADRGIIVISYAQLTGQKDKPKERLEQILQWLGQGDLAGFEGSVIFDEAHFMKAAVAISGRIDSDGAMVPSERGIVGRKLRDSLPKARVVLASATAAIRPANWAYAERFGLWGPDNPNGWQDAVDFASAVAAGGLAMMEVLCRELKARGLYMAPQLALRDAEGTEEGSVQFDQVVQPILANPELRQQWDAVARALRVARQAVISAARDAGALQDENFRQFYKQFWSVQQRIARQLTTAFTAPAVIADITRELKAGHSAVIQIASTFWQAEQRALAEAGGDAEKADLSVCRPIIDLVRRYWTGTDAERDALIERLKGTLPNVEPAITQILDHFGADNVAEYTGRPSRIIRDRDGRRIVETGRLSKRRKDLKAFMDGDVRILVFSRAGGAAVNYHADRNAQNQQRRVHYVLELFWSADAIFQGLGRTHRVGQVSAPIVKLCSTDLPVQRRFTSSAARRMIQMGALARGEQRVGAVGLFDPTDNLENRYARQALVALWRELGQGQIVPPATFTAATGLALFKGPGKPAPPPLTTQFLNRLGMLEAEEQAAIFNRWIELTNTAIQQAIEDGRYEAGVVTVRGDKIVVVNRQEIARPYEKGPPVEYVHVQRGVKTKPVPYEQITDPQGGVTSDEVVFFVRNLQTGRVYAVTLAPDKVHPVTGKVTRRYRQWDQTGRSRLVPRETFDGRKARLRWMRSMPGAVARTWWDNAIQSLPPMKWDDLHLVIGPLLPHWNKLGSQTIVRRLRTSDGELMLGRVIPAAEVDDVLANLGVDLAQPKASIEEATQAILDGRATASMANGWVLVGIGFEGEARIGVQQVARKDAKRLRDLGATKASIYGVDTWLLPLGREVDVLKRIVASIAPLNSLEHRGGAGHDDVGVDTHPQYAGGKNQMVEEHGLPVNHPAQWATDGKAETAEGRKLLRLMEKDAQKKSLAKMNVGPRAIIDFLISSMSAELRVGRTQLSRRYPAAYWKAWHLIRAKVASRGLTFHEIGHALAAVVAEVNPAAWAGMEEGLEALTSRIGSHAATKTANEGLGELVRLYVMDYGALPGDLVRQFEQVMGEIAPDILSALRDAHRAYVAFRARPFVQQAAAMEHERPRILSAWKKVRKEAKRYALSVATLVFGNRVALWQLDRTVYKAVAGTTSALRWLVSRQVRTMTKVAEDFLNQIEDTPAYLRTAYHQTLRISQEVWRILHGTRTGVSGPSVVVSGDEIPSRLTSVGFEDEEGRTYTWLDLMEQAGLPVEGIRDWPGHGNILNLGVPAWRQIKEAVGEENWDEFSIYGQYKAALDRAVRAGHNYPGQTEGLDLNTLAQKIADMEEKHPEWKEHFAAVNEFFDALLVIGVLSGEITPPEAIRMKTKWEFYWPLLRVQEGLSPLSGSRSRGEWPSGNFRNAFGSFAPFLTIDEAAEVRTRRVVEAYYQNEAIMALARFMRKVQEDETLPPEAKWVISRALVRLNPDAQVVAHLSPEEQAKIIAEYLNREKAREKGVSLAELPDEDRVEPSDLTIQMPGRPIWRARTPKTRHYILAPIDPNTGRRIFFEVVDPWIYNLFAHGGQSNRGFQAVMGALRKMIEPWRRLITQTPSFILSNTTSRDLRMALLKANRKRKGALHKSLKDYALELVPGLDLLAGIYQQVFRREVTGMQVAETLGYSVDHLLSHKEKTYFQRLKDVLKEGIVTEDWSKPGFWNKVGTGLGAAMSVLLKPVEVLLYATGMRGLSVAGEQAPRVGRYVAVRRAGWSHTYAQMMAETATVFFGERSRNPYLRDFIRSAGFLNARLQAIWETFEAIAPANPKARMYVWAVKMPTLMIIGGIMAALEYLILLAMHRDPEEREAAMEQARERPDWERYGYTNLGPIRVPTAEGLGGVFYQTGKVMVEQLLFDDPVNAAKMAEAFIKTGSRTVGIGDTINPYLKSMGEILYNYSEFYGRDIVPEWLIDAYPDNPELRAFPDTPEVYMWAGRKLRVSPLKLRYASRQIFTRVYDDLAAFLSRLERKQPVTWADVPLLRPMAAREARGRRAKSPQRLIDMYQQYHGARHALQAIKVREDQGYLSHERADELRAKIKPQLARLESAWRMNLAVESIWRKIKKERLQPKPDYDRIEELERAITRKARAFMRWYDPKAYREGLSGEEALRRIGPEYVERLVRDALARPPRPRRDEPNEEYRRRRALWRDRRERARHQIQDFGFTIPEARRLLQEIK